MFITYILYSKTLDSYYIGFTSTSVEERLKKHVALNKGHTGKAKDWEIVYSEMFTTKEGAMKLEKQLKDRKSKVRIAALIKRNSYQLGSGE